MEQPYQPPAAEPLEPPAQGPKVLDGAPAARFAAYATILLSVGLIWLLARCGSYWDLLSKIPETKLPASLRSAILDMDLDRALVAVVLLALVAILLALARLISAARALAFPALAFVGALTALTLYLLAMAQA
ncbi:hypothetical protein [Haloferula sp. BvORR071]|uniref:hypothetical protein n=1 Tax=Haloferula sp. BvORR071 TaxID=1396141 RepID=UPI000551CDC2|nr:hypothetical protein [Haloferula sp. BvORR071]